MRCLLTALATNSTEPTGGVISPIPRLTIMIIPKCTGSIPSELVTGKSTGVKIRISGAMSISVPISSSMMLRYIRITYLLSDSDVKNSVIRIGSCM
ncbi:hypothetical protein D3C78_1267500 [compost metagenome]